jgi:hypothetical protein
MFEPISHVGISLFGYAALSGYARSGSAVSDAARAARESATAIVASGEQSRALFGEKADALSRLEVLRDECGDPCWDGYDARPIDPVAIRNSEDFIRSLPDDAALPEFSAEPDGCVSMDWIRSRYRVFSVSVGATSRLAFAWLDGTDRGHGVARFDGIRAPERILEGIRGVTSYGEPSLRPA